MHRVGLQLIREKRAAIMGDNNNEKAEKQTDLQSRDLLTLLIKANMGLDIPENQRMSEEDILARECCRLPLCSDDRLILSQRCPRTYDPACYVCNLTMPEWQRLEALSISV